ncbi:hypothetical protein BKA58DRAFT_424758 [Alternaria rosae]|uniref:uncharacterized protein n=1 Tax=Alternaria rosae TaxID=1187941 RepID=UPI001E8E9A63|nr:uncharacterized protein BKA58DRAFT_424758 [Alternaria rosae]KAH6852845.1 hypothetical protein BKA58DRAFT_424758 [Alternaria rosae]
MAHEGLPKFGTRVCCMTASTATWAYFATVFDVNFHFSPSYIISLEYRKRISGPTMVASTVDIMVDIGDDKAQLDSLPNELLNLVTDLVVSGGTPMAVMRLVNRGHCRLVSWSAPVVRLHLLRERAIGFCPVHNLMNRRRTDLAPPQSDVPFGTEPMISHSCGRITYVNEIANDHGVQGSKTPFARRTRRTATYRTYYPVVQTPR